MRAQFFKPRQTEVDFVCWQRGCATVVAAGVILFQRACRKYFYNPEF